MIDHRVTSLTVVLAVFLQGMVRAETLPTEALPQDRKVVFSREIAPVLAKNCVACHNASNEEGGVNLETESLRRMAQMKSADAVDVLIPGKPDASQLYMLASHAEEPVMPPEDNDVSASALNSRELALLRRWIESGAEIDQVGMDLSERTWQPLPPTLHTVFGTSMTADGRLSAVSFGNQIQLFGATSDQPIGALEIGNGDQTKPAHDDFVQDVLISESGRSVVSAGYRNVKLWELNPFELTLIPRIEHEDTLAIAMSASGSHLAVLSRRGELSVAEVGQQRWQWMKSFDIPDELVGDHPTEVHLAVSANGHQAAVGWDNTIRVVMVDGKETQSIEMTDRITSMLWRQRDELATTDTAGQVAFWRRENGSWTAANKQGVFDQATLGVFSAAQDPNRMVAMDLSGNIANWNETEQRFDQAGKLPSPVASVSLGPTGDMLWATTTKGALVQYNIDEKKFIEVAKWDPAAVAKWETDKWKTLVGERLLAALDKEVKQAAANVTAEEKSVETFAKAIETKTKQRDEKKAGLTAAETKAETAAMKLAEAIAAEKTNKQKRAELSLTENQLAADMAKVESQLKELKGKHADTEKALAALPDAKKLAETVKAMSDASTKADQAKAKSDSEFSMAVDALRLAEETKDRGENRLIGLKNELESRRQLHSDFKAEQDTRKATEASSVALRNQSQATGKKFAVMAAGNRVIARAINSGDDSAGKWSLWSGGGDWIASLPELAPDDQFIAAGDDCVVIQAIDGSTRALRRSRSLWRHQTTIGSSIGKSPFSDRVLSVDVDPNGKFLATGGGEPSRGGELMIWDVVDGSLIRVIENSHNDTVLSVRFSPDGKILATAAADRMIKLWEVESGRLIKTLEGHTHHVTAVAWNENLRQLASGSADETIKIWDVETGKATRTISGLKTEITGLEFVGRDNRIAVVGGNGYFRVYRTDNGGRETNVKIPGGYLYALDSNRDGTQLVAGGSDGVAVVIDKSGKQKTKYSRDTD